MFRSDLILQILAVFVLNILFLQCGAERDININETIEDDDYGNFTITTKENQTFNFPTYRPSHYRKRGFRTTEDKIIFVVIAVVVIVVGVLIRCCCYYLKQNEQEETQMRNAIVHPPPVFSPPNRASSILPPTANHPVFVSIYNPNRPGIRTHNTETDSINQTPLLDLPPSYESVVRGDNYIKPLSPTVFQQQPKASNHSNTDNK